MWKSTYDTKPHESGAFFMLLNAGNGVFSMHRILARGGEKG